MLENMSSEQLEAASCLVRLAGFGCSVMDPEDERLPSHLEWIWEYATSSGSHENIQKAAFDAILFSLKRDASNAHHATEFLDLSRRADLLRLLSENRVIGGARKSLESLLAYLMSVELKTRFQLVHKAFQQEKSKSQRIPSKPSELQGSVSLGMGKHSRTAKIQLHAKLSEWSQVVCDESTPWLRRPALNIAAAGGALLCVQHDAKPKHVSADPENRCTNDCGSGRMYVPSSAADKRKAAKDYDQAFRRLLVRCGPVQEWYLWPLVGASWFRFMEKAVPAWIDGEAASVPLNADRIQQEPKSKLDAVQTVVERVDSALSELDSSIPREKGNALLAKTGFIANLPSWAPRKYAEIQIDNLLEMLSPNSEMMQSDDEWCKSMCVLSLANLSSCLHVTDQKRLDECVACLLRPFEVSLESDMPAANAFLLLDSSPQVFHCSAVGLAVLAHGHFAPFFSSGMSGSQSNGLQMLRKVMRVLLNSILRLFRFCDVAADPFSAPISNFDRVVLQENLSGVEVACLRGLFLSLGLCADTLVHTRQYDCLQNLGHFLYDIVLDGAVSDTVFDGAVAAFAPILGKLSFLSLWPASKVYSAVEAMVGRCRQSSGERYLALPGLCSLVQSLSADGFTFPDKNFVQNLCDSQVQALGQNSRYQRTAAVLGLTALLGFDYLMPWTPTPSATSRNIVVESLARPGSVEAVLIHLQNCVNGDDFKVGACAVWCLSGLAWSVKLAQKREEQSQSSSDEISTALSMKLGSLAPPTSIVRMATDLLTSSGAINEEVVVSLLRCFVPFAENLTLTGWHVKKFFKLFSDVQHRKVAFAYLVALGGATGDPLALHFAASQFEPAVFLAHDSDLQLVLLEHLSQVLQLLPCDKAATLVASLGSILLTSDGVASDLQAVFLDGLKHIFEKESKDTDRTIRLEECLLSNLFPCLTLTSYEKTLESFASCCLHIPASRLNDALNASPGLVRLDIRCRVYSNCPSAYPIAWLLPCRRALVSQDLSPNARQLLTRSLSRSCVGFSPKAREEWVADLLDVAKISALPVPPLSLLSSLCSRWWPDPSVGCCQDDRDVFSDIEALPVNLAALATAENGGWDVEAMCERLGRLLPSNPVLSRKHSETDLVIERMMVALFASEPNRLVSQRPCLRQLIFLLMQDF